MGRAATRVRRVRFPSASALWDRPVIRRSSERSSLRPNKDVAVKVAFFDRSVEGFIRRRIPFLAEEAHARRAGGATEAAAPTV